MDCYVGIDLGSTTTKAIFLDDNERILGKGITNSRSNYEIACQVAKEEAEISARFAVLHDKISHQAELKSFADDILSYFSSKYKLAQHNKQLYALEEECLATLKYWFLRESERKPYEDALTSIFHILHSTSESIFQPGDTDKSDFFRDIATSLFLHEAEVVCKDNPISFDRLVGVFDKAILRVENQSFAKYFPDYLEFACQKTIEHDKYKKLATQISKQVQEITQMQFNIRATVGTGYGRMTLPFPKEQIRSEILCHGLGAHYFFPNTHTVLDIGGQDTKAIQVDPTGIVTNFQMNDRCAAGCGRYLGYIADEMNMGVHQLGPMAMQASKSIRINSTCTVFAGAELRERLSLGEKREDILAGLHRAIILRAMSLLARSGGIFSEFTFTGGVAKNEAATNALCNLVKENYGNIKINISPDSIFTGALGAALFAKRDKDGKYRDISLKEMKTKKK